MKRSVNAYIIARNTSDNTGRVEYWTGIDWSFNKADSKTFRTLQAVDSDSHRIPALRDSSTMLYVTQ